MFLSTYKVPDFYFNLLFAFKAEGLRNKQKSSICWFNPHQPGLRPGWKEESQNLIQVSHTDGRDPGSYAVTCCQPGCALAESWNWKQSRDLNSGTPTWEAGVLTPGTAGALSVFEALFWRPSQTSNYTSSVFFPEETQPLSLLSSTLPLFLESYSFLSDSAQGPSLGSLLISLYCNTGYWIAWTIMSKYTYFLQYWRMLDMRF